MISFKVLSEENKEKIIKELSCSSAVRRELLELAGGLDFSDPDVEFALSYFSGCALVRVFDMGRYLFLYPFAIEDDADTAAALDAIAEYAMREELPLVIDDVPREYVSDFLIFRHIDVDARDPYGESYRIRVKTECELLNEIPEIDAGRVKLSALIEADIPEYARLCKDKNVNKCWGYDYSEDVSDPSDEYFYETALSELSMGVSLTMAVRYGDRFVGEAVLYAFDGRGCAEFAVRLLPEWQGKGLGTETVRAICAAAREMGLVRLCSRVMKENSASVNMLRKITDEHEEGECEVVFYVDLEDF